MIGLMRAELSFAEKPTITGERVLLRPVDPADAAGLAALDDEALRLTGTQRKASMKKLRQWYATRAKHTDRLDLSAENARAAAMAGVKIAISTDAHSTREFGLIRCGMDQARRAGLQQQSGNRGPRALLLAV